MLEQLHVHSETVADTHSPVVVEKEEFNNIHHKFTEWITKSNELNGCNPKLLDGQTDLQVHVTNDPVHSLSII